MNNRQLALLLLVPAVAMAARTRARRHQWAFNDAGRVPAEDDAQGGHDPRQAHDPHHGFGPRGGHGRWGGHGPRGGGPWFARGAGPFGGRVPPMMKAMLDDWHRQAHGEAGTEADTESGAAGEVRV